jgi:lysophospholipase L1-like esterase
MTSRRHFLKGAALSAAMSFALPDWLEAAIPTAEELAPLAAGKTILFQGDSITDASRNKNVKAANHTRALGTGYAALAAAQVLAKRPQEEIKVYNRGISGNKVFQLADRWQEDCLDLQPDVLSILIGVNDYWHTLSNNYQGTVPVYEKDFRALLDRTKAQFPEIKLIICEPFMVKGGSALTEVWHTDFPPYQAAAARIASDYGAVWLPFQDLFDKALTKGSVAHWCPDGVHPSPAGNYLMAQAWLKGLKKALKG